MLKSVRFTEVITYRTRSSAAERSVHIGKATGSNPVESTFMGTINILLIASIFSLIFGQLVRVPIFTESALTITDILVAALDICFLANALAVKKSLSLPKLIFIPALLFSAAASLSTVLAMQTFTSKEILISLMFLIRFIMYFFVSIVVANTVSKSKVSGFLNIILVAGFVFITAGFFQLLVFPDLSSLAPFGWDPHQQRITSTFLDPNFAGMLIVMLFTIASCKFLFTKRPVYLLYALISFASLMLTFSRSTYLALLAAVAIIGIYKSKKILAAFLMMFIISFVLIPQVRSRIVGAANVDETSQARIESWQKAIKIFGDNPIFGVGFNTYRFAQEKYGFFDLSQPEGGHSGGGSDSSILTVAATTGVFGLFFFLWLLVACILHLAKKAQKNPSYLAALSIFAALVVNSQFVNSLFFPQIMLVMWFTLGLTFSRNST